MKCSDPWSPTPAASSNRIWGCLAKGVRKVEGRHPEEGIEVFEWTLEEFYRAITDGRFDHALHMAIVFQAILRTKIHAPRM